MKKYIYIIFSALSLFTFASCADVLEDEYQGTCPINGLEEGDFAITMNIPALDVASRSIAGDPENGGNTWSTWENFCDGALLYRVTLFVVDNEGTLVGYRDFYKGSSDIKAEDSEYGGNGFYANGAVGTDLATAVAVKATFKAKKPIHGNIEKLQAQNYKVYAVANYAPINETSHIDVYDGTNVYLGLGTATADVDATSTTKNGESGDDVNDFTTIVNNIIDNFDTSTGLANFNQTNYSAFFDYKLNAGTDRICKMQPQPLVMIRSVDLSTTNQLSGELARTFARIRLTVQNVNTGIVQIGISNLAFNNAYASQKAYLFNDVGTDTSLNLHDHFDLYASEDSPDDTELNTKGLLDVTSGDAIINFDSSDDFRMIAGTSRDFFDCYLLEGMISQSNAYSFTATYWTNAQGGNATENITIQEWKTFLYDDNGYHRQVFIRNDANNGQKLLQANYVYNENKYITGGNVTISDNQENAVDNADEALAPELIWEVQPVPASPAISGQLGSTYGELYSIGTGMYLQPYAGGSDMTPQLAYTATGGKIFFKINFNGDHQDELGSIYCIYNGYFYYISGEGKWTKTSYTGTDTTTSPPSSDSGYQRLTFETIPGVSGDEVNKIVEKTIQMSGSSTDTENRIVRNDFFWGTIPLYVNEQNLGVSLSDYELVWYIGEDASAQTVTVTKRSESLTYEYTSPSSFTISESDDVLTVTPTSTESACEETVTVTCSNGDKVTLTLKVIEKPAATTINVNLTFQYKSGNGNRTIGSGVTASSDVENSLSYSSNQYTFTLTYTEEDLDKEITFSYTTSNYGSGTYTSTMTIKEFIDAYGTSGGTITLSSNYNYN